MIRIITFLFLFSVTSVYAFQKQNCEELDDSDLIWDLNQVDGTTFTMNTSTSTGSTPNPLCPGGGSPNNMTWFSFIAGYGDYEIVLTPSNCVDSGGFIGIQSGLYTDCTYTESIYCEPACSTAPISIPSSSTTVLVPGDVYYLFLDGCAGSVCDIIIELVGDYTPFGIPEPTDLICDFDCTAVLIDQILNVAVEGVDAYSEYYWIIPNDVEIIDPLMPSNFTEDNNINLRFAEAGIYNICFDYATNGTATSTIQLCKEINVVGEFEANASATNESAFMANNGSASCMPNGSGSYVYNWSNGGSGSSISNLAPGEYTVTVMDQEFNLEAQAYVLVDTFVCDSIMFDVDVINNSCFAVCDATININVSGNDPFTYIWNTNQTTSDLSGLCAGSYRVTITDSLNCQVVSDDILVQQPNILLVNAEADNTAAIALPSGGTEPYDYQWSNGDSTQTIVNLAAGIYTVTVEDANGCQAVESVITDIQFSVDSLINISDTSLGAIYISTNAEEAEYQWTGPNGYTSLEEDIVGLEDAGCYMVSLTDINTALSRDTVICIDNLTPVADERLLKNVNLFPIPAASFINVVFGSSAKDVVTKIYDIAGALVMKINHGKLDVVSFDIDVSTLNNGVYSIELNTHEGNYFDKIIVSR